MRYKNPDITDSFKILIMRAKMTEKDFCVSYRTFKVWLDTDKPPPMARKLAHIMCGDLGTFSKSWNGWRICRITGDLFTNEDMQYAQAEIKALHYYRQGLVSKRIAERRAAKMPLASVTRLRLIRSPRFKERRKLDKDCSVSNDEGFSEAVRLPMDDMFKS